MKYPNILFSTLIVLLLAGCQYISRDDGNGAAEFFENAEPVSFETIEKGSYGNQDVEERNAVIRDTEAFSSFWMNLHEGVQPMPSVPEVDFTGQMVVATVMGTRPSGGYASEITHAGSGFDRLGIRIKNRTPGNSCGVTAALTNPYHIVKIERSELEVRFFEEEEVQDCTE